MLRWRWCLVLAYLSASLLAQVAHDHGSDAHAPDALLSCRDGGVHLADHPDAPDLSRPDNDCVACRFLNQPSASPDDGVTSAAVPRVGPTALPTCDRDSSTVPVHRRGRSPPVV